MTKGNEGSMLESATCAFERDENDMLQQIKDWEPEQGANQ